MKVHYLITYLILTTIFSVVVTSCCHNCSDDINKSNINQNQTCLKNKYFSHTVKTPKTIQKLKNLNIIYFNFDQYNVLPQFFNILNKHADFLRTHQEYKIIIEGHTDERGTPEYNIALGERRANSVKIYLQTQGVMENQISFLSYGKEKPEFLGHSEKEYAKNRRAVLVY